MKLVARVVAIAAVSLSALSLTPAAAADPAATLPPMTSTGGGPVVGGGSSAAVSQQLFSFKDPNVQEVDGNDAAQFINAAAGLADRNLATVFQPLQRALGCQTNGAGFGARAYRRADGQWGGGMLVIVKANVPNVDALRECVKGSWRRATVGTPTSMCNSGWSYPPYTGRKTDGYFVLLSGTNSDFCTGPNANYRTNASSWPT